MSWIIGQTMSYTLRWASIAPRAVSDLINPNEGKMKKTLLRYTLALLHLFVLEIFLSGSAIAQQPNIGIQAVISSQDAEGMTRKDMTPEFLTNLENHTRQQIEIKSQAYLEANGVRNKKIVIKADGV